MGVRCAVTVSVSKLKKCCDETKHQGAKHDNGPKPKSHKGTWPSWPWISGLVLSMFEIAGNGSLLERNGCDFTLMAIGSVSIGTALWISFVGCKSVYVMCVCVLYHVDVLQVSVSTVHRSISTSSIKCKKMSCNWL